MRKITVIGNIAGGKTRLSQKIATIHNLPLTHVDAIQFLSNMQIRALDETRKILNEIEARPQWIIDGFGPLDLIEERFQRADCIVYVDLPIWRHTWWCTKRQIKNLWSKRAELTDKANEATVAHTAKLYKTLWRIHKKMRPELIKILNRENLKHKTIFVRDLKHWNSLFTNGISR